MATIFTKIISGEIPSHKIAEDENYYAFLDISPLVKGHVLVVPKIEADYIFDLDDKILSGLMIFAKKIAKAMDKALDCKRIGVEVIGLEVPHAHVHLLPLNQMDDMNFSKPKLKMTSEELMEIANKIKEKL